ncbi:MAG: [Fe-Fe] hydrogenase large subunit C-terminal domain-containing protein [Eubacteriales bacterium]|nr:[Fe-Fe] hydrogenase large subunit C-terminal domain-containing protein [Eubacteriales bacterium]
MAEYKHSVSLDVEKCKGCTHCLKRCPTEAIRIRNGHAVIDSNRCIDCGECIRQCPHQAKKAVFDKYSAIPKDKYTIALPAPTFYGQFEHLDDIDYLLQGLLDLGFDDVFEVACAAELITEYTRRYLKREDINLPVISSACPVVVRLVSLRFPTLVKNLMPIMPPMELAGIIAREKAKKKHPELKDDDICTVFISPCPAKVSYVKNNLVGYKSNIDMVVSMSDLYFELLNVMKKRITPIPYSRTGMIGVGWAISGGESSSLMNDHYLAADGIENIIKVLEDIDTAQHRNLDFVELNACSGGCVGGVLTVENPYLARVRLRNVKRYLPVSQNHPPESAPEIGMPDEYAICFDDNYKAVSSLGPDRKQAMKLMSDIDEVFKTLPELDCGSCGSPTCRAFAEDVVKGNVKYEECIVVMREKLKDALKSEEC